MDPPTRRLWLVRHGLPDYRGGRPGDLLPGPPLSTVGYDQAAQAARRLQSCAVETIYSSPLSRTRQTADVMAQVLGRPVVVDHALREWHRTERLHEVGVRLTSWLVGWLRSGEANAVAVSHASPILAILRSALYLPHTPWHKPGQPNTLELSSADRFEVTMASVFEVTITAESVTAVCRFHAQPRILHAQRDLTIARLPRHVVGDGECRVVRRPNLLRLVGYGWRRFVGRSEL